MNKIVNAQTLLFLTSIEIGILMGVAFDLIRIFRKLIKHPNFFVQIEDMLYWVFCAFMGFYMLYICNYAAIRPFIFAGIILGGLFYFLTFSIVFMKVATIIIGYLKWLIGKVVFYVMLPIKWLIRLILRPIRYGKNKCQAVNHQLELKHRKRKRQQYEVQMEKRVDHYLKNKKIREDKT